jgi:hypothetical protein
LENPEVHHPHAGHGGGLPRWLELTLAIAALVTSVSSIAIAVHHGEIMNKLVEANSIPYLQGGFSDATDDGRAVLSLDLLNRGVGPAHQKSLRVKVDGRYVHNVQEFLAATLGPEQATAAMKPLHFTWNGVATRFVPGGQSQLIFRTAKTAENAIYWDQLMAAENRWSIEYCYCSVFDECWWVRSKWAEPEPAKHCVRDEPKEFVPGR